MKHQNIVLGLSCLLLVPGTWGCQSQSSSAGSGRVEPSGTVTHVVLLWLKDPQDAAGRQQIIEASKSFKQIPGVLSVAVGIPLPDTRPTVDTTYDLGIAITMRDKAALEAYGPHPIHQKAANEVLLPRIKSIKAYDIESK